MTPRRERFSGRVGPPDSIQYAPRPIGTRCAAVRTGGQVENLVNRKPAAPWCEAAQIHWIRRDSPPAKIRGMDAANSSDTRPLKFHPTKTELAALADHLDRISTGQYPPLRTLKVCDRVRLMHFPTEYLQVGSLHPETRKLYKFLLRRKPPVLVAEIDEWGLQWIRCQLRGMNRRMEHHLLLIGTESGWVKVKRKRDLTKR